MSDSILIVDDEESVRTVLDLHLKDLGYETNGSTKLSETYSLLKKTEFELILLDINLPDGNSLDYLDKIKKLANNASIIVITAQDTMNNAIEAMKNGAYDYLSKPFEFDSDFALTVERAVKNSINTKKILSLEKDLSNKDYQESEIIGKSPEIKKIFKDIGRISQSEHTVLVTGESGTGKELVAKAIHSASSNSKGNYVQINITAIPNDLLESELFGYEKGAFTGADTKKIGRFEEANGGTILLDEIGDMSYSVQSKLLRVLEERKFYRLGSQKPVKFDCRIIASTNKNLEKEVENKNFREDLFFRLNSINIEIPPLRERKSDIPLLIDFFLNKYSDLKDSTKSIDKEFLEVFLKYDWPGNIRELENSIKKIVLMVPDNELTVDSIKEHLGKLLEKTESINNNVDYRNLIENLFNDKNIPETGIYEFIINRIEKPMIESLLIKNNGDLTLTSKQLDISNASLDEKIKILKIDKTLIRK
ncbi:MAG: sigma-54 dependent transcriptional regulator [Thermodesulfobacteriota bacterium]|nr:sigma-54 dependent transcriptional regulator [Thermodesulfobacteriota bacterium]